MHSQLLSCWSATLKKMYGLGEKFGKEWDTWEVIAAFLWRLKLNCAIHCDVTHCLWYDVNQLVRYVGIVEILP